jgi:mRNA interferase RelE/StbE
MPAWVNGESGSPWMTFKLDFLESADKEWRKLNPNLREQFKKKLAERLENPRVQKDQLHGAKDRYKIKLKRAGYRLVYQVIDTEIVVLVIALGKREGSAVYEAAAKR